MRLISDFIKNVLRLLILKKLFFGLGLLFFCRLVWFICNYFWLTVPSNSEILYSFVIGVYMDLPVLAWFYFPMWIWLAIFPNKSLQFPIITRSISAISSFVILLLTAIDCAYSGVIGRRSGTDLFLLLEDKSNHFAPYLIEYWWAVLLLLFCTWLVWKYTPVKGLSLFFAVQSKPWFYKLACTLFFAGIWLLAVRGGFRIKPLTAMDAADFVSPALAPVSTSTPLQMLSTFGQNTLPQYQFMNENEAENLVLAGHSKDKSTHKNIVLIIVESLGRDYTGFLNKTAFTPFIDSLSNLSLNFRYCYANGVKSIEMVPSIFCGIPNLLSGQFINSPYSVNRMENAFKAFEKVGYSTAFYHGASNGTMRFESFLAQTGLTQYFGMDQYPDNLKSNDYDGNWGIFDEPYLHYFGNQLSEMKEPFFASIFTVSSHHPYRIPMKYKGKLPMGRLPIHQTIAYADASLRTFFNEVSKKRWYKNTIFVITGDHTSYSKDAYFYSETGHYEIPLLIFQPQGKAAIIDKTMSQCDIIPTVSDLVGLQTDFFGMGRSVFDSAYAGYSVHRSNNINFIVQYPFTLGMDDDGKVIDFYQRLRNDTEVQHLLHQGKTFDAMSQYLKASLQVYSFRIRNNHWYR
jgi:phosphoglycerol transferase MdoB-like AlkP superfamily enzyme